VSETVYHQPKGLLQGIIKANLNADFRPVLNADFDLRVP
jgi:hypothetical protein